MIFFHPTNDFIDWLVRYANGRTIVDIGCGEGELLKKLYKYKYTNFIGVDLFVSDVLWDTFRYKGVHLLELDMRESTVLKKFPSDKTLFLFCRPCHGGFVQLALMNLPTHAEVLYIGKEENLSIDIPDNYTYSFLKTPALTEEKVYRLRACEPACV